MKINKAKTLNKNDYIKIFRLFIIISILFSTIYITIFQRNYNFHKSNTIELIVLENNERLKQIDFVIQYLNKEIVSDLLVIKNSAEFNNYIYKGVNYKEEAQQLFYRIAKNKKQFNQIRFLDKEGYELIRINNEKDTLKILDDKELQYKGDRYYFNETKMLDEGEFFYSPLDLNIEKNEIEVPYKPTIRISTPVFDNNNNFIGILIINYLGENLINILKQEIDDSTNKFIEFSLLNENGDYLYNKSSEKTFSFMFDDKNYNISDEFKSFNENKKREDSYFIENNIVYSIKKIVPTKSINTNKDTIWYLVSSFDINNITVVSDRFILNLSLLQFILLIFINLFFFILIYYAYLRYINKQQLEITTKIANVTTDGIIIADKNRKIIFVNTAYENISGYTFQNLINTESNFINVSMYSKSFCNNIWNKINLNGVWEGDLWDKKSDGLLYPKHLKIYAIRKNYNNNIDKYIGVYSDLSKAKDYEKNINKLLNYNNLTNLPNEQLLLKLINTKIINNEKFLGLLCFSIINYNDILLTKDPKGQEECLTRFIHDIYYLVNKNDIFAQISKNTFVILLSSYNNKTEVENFVKEFIKFNENRNSINKNDSFIDIKCGVSVYPTISSTSKKLLTSANIALSEAIKTNHDFVFSSKELEKHVNKMVNMNMLLRKSIINNELEVYYQAQINNNTNKIIGAEALMRWTTPTLGSVSPYYFIPIAEKSGFIVDLGYWIIEKVFIDYNKIKEFLPFNFKFSINISAIQFEDDNLIDKIIELSNKYHIDLSNFEIEITESVFASDMKEINNKLNKFRRLGFSIALDDFGTGYSSLSYLKQLVIDRIKIDRAFIKDYPQNDNGSIAKIIVNIAKELNVNLICEGVETKEQLDYINSIGCSSIQGYYFSKPLDYTHFKKYISQF